MSREQRVGHVFVELADTLVGEFNMLDLMHTLADRSVELLDVDAAGLILADQDGHLQPLASTTHQAHLLELYALQNSEGPCLDCFQTGKPVVNLTTREMTNRWPRFQAAVTEAGYGSAHALPLRLRDQVIGAMNVFCADRSPFSDDDIALGQALADIATISLLQERAAQHKDLLAEQLQTAMNSRILLERANGALSERADVDLDEAFAMMRSYSRRNMRPLASVATAVLEGSITHAELLAA